MVKVASGLLNLCFRNEWRELGIEVVSVAKSIERTFERVTEEERRVGLNESLDKMEE